MTKLEELVIVKDEDINLVREKYGKNPQEIQEDLKIIKEWLGKQPHLPEAASKDEGRLERQLMRNKFRLEKTKKKLDGYYTLRGLYPEFYHIPRIHPKSREMVEARSSSFVFPLPKMSNGERIWVFHVKNSDPSTFDFPILLSHILMILELTASLDYPLGDRWVIDVKNLTFGHFTRMEPIALGKWFKLHQESFSGRILGIHYLNAPSFMDVLLKLLKAVLSPKIYDRVSCHWIFFTKILQNFFSLMGGGNIFYLLFQVGEK